MGVKEQVDAVSALNGAAPIFDPAPAPAGHVHPGAEGVIAGISGDCTVFREKIPGKEQGA